MLMIKKGKVYFKESLAGDISQQTDGLYTFQYLNSESPAVSLTLPNQKESFQSEELFPFFDGLIPEGWLLNLAHKNWKVSQNDRMTLLLTTCQDCIGAASVQGNENQMPLQSVIKKSNPIQPVPESDRCLICLQDLGLKEHLYHKQCAKSLFGFAHAPDIDVDQDQLENLALLQINQRLTLTGVQKKLSLSPYKDPNQNKTKERLTIMGSDGRFILKPSTPEYLEMPMVEHVSMKLAELHGLTMARCGLVYLASGELAYLTKRFDRINHQKVAVEDFCQLSRALTSKKYNSSSEKLGKVIDEFSSAPGDDKVTLFQVILFSFWIGNADMHLKNFSLWKDPKNGLIRMSPGYDYLSTRMLISAKDDKEELALPINGKKNKIQWKDFETLAKNLGISSKVALRIKERMLDLLPESQELIYRSFLQEETKHNFVQLIERRSKVLV